MFSFARSALRPHGLFALVLICFLITSCYLAFRIAPFAAPNEGLHYENVAILRNTHWLPPPSVNADERHQPPIYYTLAAIFSGFVDNQQQPEFQINPFFSAPPRGNHNPVVQPSPMIYAARLASVLFGCLGVIGVYSAGLRLLGNSPGNTAAALVATLLAFQPNYLYLGATIGNDVPVAAASACVLAIALRLIASSSSSPSSHARAFIFGAVLGLGMLIKANAVIMGIGLPAAWLAEYRRAGIRPMLRNVLFSLLGVAVLYTPWVVLNQLRNDPLGLAKSLPLRQVLMNNPLSFGSLWPYVTRIWQSIWLDWSPGEIGYALPWIYTLAAGILLFALAGWLIRERPTTTLMTMPNIATVALCVVPICVIVYLYIATKALAIKQTHYFVPEGRWMLPVFPILALLAGGGWWRWWPTARKPLMAGLAILGYIAGTLSLLVWHLPEIQPRAQVISLTQIPPNAQQPHLRYGVDQAIELAAVAAPDGTIGQRLDVSLYWRAHKSPDQNFAVAARLQVPLADSPWPTLDHTNTFPGYGTSPTQGWHAGEVIADRLTLYPSTTLTLAGPVRAYLIINLVSMQSVAATLEGVSLPVLHDGNPMNLPVAQEIGLHPARSLSIPLDAGLPDRIQFGEGIQLAGLTSRWENDKLHLVLWWRAVGNINKDLIMFTHVVDAHGQLLAQSDGVPNHGLSPTHIWRSGEVIRDEREIALPQTSNIYLYIGAYDSTSKERVSVTQNDRPVQDNILMWPGPK